MFNVVFELKPIGSFASKFEAMIAVYAAVAARLGYSAEVIAMDDEDNAGCVDFLAHNATEAVVVAINYKAA